MYKDFKMLLADWLITGLEKVILPAQRVSLACLLVKALFK